MITIHNFARGAGGLRAMWQCEEIGLPCHVEMVSSPPSEAYRALNPLGSVPFLEDEGGVAIQSALIPSARSWGTRRSAGVETSSGSIEEISCLHSTEMIHA